MTDYKKRIDGLIELWCRQEFENERPYGRVTRNIVTPEFVNKLNDLLHQVEAETDRNSRIDELTALPFTEREISCMDCLATHIVKDRLATLKKGDLHE